MIRIVQPPSGHTATAARSPPRTTLITSADLSGEEHPWSEMGQAGLSFVAVRTCRRSSRSRRPRPAAWRGSLDPLSLLWWRMLAAGLRCLRRLRPCPTPFTRDPRPPRHRQPVSFCPAGHGGPHTFTADEGGSRAVFRSAADGLIAGADPPEPRPQREDPGSGSRLFTAKEQTQPGHRSDRESASPRLRRSSRAWFAAGGP